MATQPSRDDPSDPETKSSQSENIQEMEPVLLLRTAKSLILPLRIPDQWEEQPLPAAAPSRSTGASPIVSFKATTHVLDPGTQRPHTITLSIGPGIDDDANIFLESDSIPMEGTWRASLYAGTALKANVPFADERVELHHGLPAGIYTIKLTSGDAPVLPALTIALEPFNLPEALQAGETYLARRRYIRAEAVLSDAAERYPENADAQDLLVLAHTLATADPAAWQEEQAEFGVFRSVENLTRQASHAFQEARSKFGERVGTLIAGRTLGAVTVSDATLAQSTEAVVSTAVVRSLMLLKKQLEANKSPQDEPVLRFLTVISGRLEHLEAISGELSSRIDAVRSDTQKSDDDKFALVKELLQHYTDEIARSRIAAPDYEPFFREEVGEACWDWLGVDVQRVFSTAEELYHYQDGKPSGARADFTPAVLEICRGFEELLNDKLGEFCKSIQDAIKRDEDCTAIARKEFQEKTLTDILKTEHSMSMWKIATLLRLGRMIHAAQPNVCDPKLGALLALSPGPADIEQVVFLSYIASELRNGKVHTAEHTSAHGMWLARKLVLGLDERGVGYGNIQGWIKESRFKKDAEVHKKKISAIWAEFPGIVPMLWKALGAAAPAAAA
jgi:hypothetical protein